MKLLTFLLAVAPAFSQTSSDATVQALLVEVRQLRIALERSAVVAPKIQVTLQRIQLQQDQVSRISRQLEEAREQGARLVAESSELELHVKSSESVLAQEQDPGRRKMLEDQIKSVKARIDQMGEQHKAKEAQQQAREAEIAGRLRVEQGKLNELNDRLDTLERLLDAPKQP